MITYIDTCLSLNKPREAKDGLHQYRNLAQSQAPGSLENVIRYMIEKSEERCKEAKEIVDSGKGLENVTGSNEAEALVDPAGAPTDSPSANVPSLVMDEEDEEDEHLPTADTANMILLSTMTSNPQQNQIESTLLLPRIKFLWEVYRAVLDILKSNSKLEHLYHDTAVKALDFCMVYKRRIEFRRICDLLRMHLQTLQKYGGREAMAKVQDGGKPNSKVRPQKR